MRPGFPVAPERRERQPITLPPAWLCHAGARDREAATLRLRAKTASTGRHGWAAPGALECRVHFQMPGAERAFPTSPRRRGTAGPEFPACSWQRAREGLPTPTRLPGFRIPEAV